MSRGKVEEFPSIPKKRKKEGVGKIGHLEEIEETEGGGMPGTEVVHFPEEITNIIVRSLPKISE